MKKVVLVWFFSFQPIFSCFKSTSKFIKICLVFLACFQMKNWLKMGCLKIKNKKTRFSIQFHLFWLHKKKKTSIQHSIIYNKQYVTYFDLFKKNKGIKKLKQGAGLTWLIFYFSFLWFIWNPTKKKLNSYTFSLNMFLNNIINFYLNFF